MKKVLFSVAAACSVVTLPMPAAATPTTAAAYEGGRCLVAQDRRAAVALMASLPLGEGVADLSGVGERGAGCVDSLAGAAPLLVRGAIAQAMLLRDFRGLGQEPRDSRVIVDLNLPVAAFGTAPDRTTRLYGWGDCVTRNDPNGVDRMLRTPVGSPEEREALGGLQTFMTQCMSQGQELTVRTWEVRSVFAQASYHMLYRYWTGQLESVRR